MIEERIVKPAGLSFDAQEGLAQTAGADASLFIEPVVPANPEEMA